MPKVDRELAKMLYPKPSDVVQEAMGGKAQAAYAYGTAASDSDGGTVTVVMEGETAGVDAAIEVPTSCAISEGDTVLVSVSGNVPVEAVSKGSGDVTRSIASDALNVANATGQYFWHDTNGAHVSTDAGDAEGASNSLWNSLGLLIRKAANYLVSITQSAIAFYDGNGNASSNIVAQFGSTGAQIGKTGAANIALDSTKTVFSGSGGTELLTIEAANSNASIDHATEYMTVGHLASSNSLSTVTTRYAVDTKYVESRAQDSHNIASTEAQISNTGVSASLDAEDSYTNARVLAKTDLNGGSLVRLEANDVYVDTSGAYYQFTGAGNIRTNDSGGNATAYFVKYDATSDTRTQLEHRGACIWQNSSGNLHLANGMSDSDATWEYSFEAGGLYRRTKSGGTWSGWANIG